MSADADAPTARQKKVAAVAAAAAAAAAATAAAATATTADDGSASSSDDKLRRSRRVSKRAPSRKAARGKDGAVRLWDATSMRLVRHLADLFDRYALHRPQMVRAWARGPSCRWG